MELVNGKALGKLQEKDGEAYKVEKEKHRKENYKNNEINRSSGQTRKIRSSEPAIAQFQHLGDVCDTGFKKKGRAVDSQVCQECSDMEMEDNNETQLSQEEEAKRVAWTETESNKGNLDSESATQTERQGYRSSYLYDRNPLQDPRFTRLVERLVPLRTQLHAERNKLLDSNRKTNEKWDEICFKDICLNDTCRLVFKIMNKGNGDFRKR